MEWCGIWNTEHDLRGWRFDGERQVGALNAEQCQEVLGEQPPDRVLIAGAGGAPTQDLPALLMPDALHSGHDGLVLPALRQPRPAHRIDGSRLTAIGFAALNPKWDGTLCLPGPVTHWLNISAGEVIYLQGSLTPTLAASLDLDGAIPDTDTLSEGISRPERMAAGLRSASVDGRRDSALGWLMGAELAATRALWLGQQVAIVGEGTGARAYQAALSAQGLPVTTAQAPVMAEKGMLALAARFGLTG